MESFKIMKRSNYSFSSIIMTIFIVIGQVLFSNKTYGVNLLYEADSLYLRHNYFEALNRYQFFIEHDKYLQKDFTINFKIALCFFYQGYYYKSKEILENLKQNNSQLIEYIDYFLFLCTLKISKFSKIKELAMNYQQKYVEHFLADSVIFYLAEKEFEKRDYKNALKHYLMLEKKQRFKNRRPYFIKQIVLIKLKNNEKDRFLYSYQLMKNYPSSRFALELAQKLQSENIVSEDEKLFFSMIEVYIKHEYYDQAKYMLERYIKHAGKDELKERSRFYLLLIYYNRKEYQVALYGFQNMLTQLLNKTLEPRIMLYIARCYLSMQQKSNAAHYYIKYAKDYPRRRLSVEAIWKSAWIFEELGEIKEALSLYQEIVKHWPYSRYKEEAQFRKGLSYFRLADYGGALESFQEIIKNGTAQIYLNRASYWLSKTYECIGYFKKANEIQLELGKSLFDDYYTIKCYLLHKDHIDTLLKVKEKLTVKTNPLNSYKESLINYIEEFEKFFIIREILGDNVVFNELIDNKYKPNSLKSWAALAEVYKRLGAFHHAYRIYDYIDRKYFNDKINLDKPFILKESFPLYYDNLVNHFCNERKLDKNLILAIIREESKYNRHAHSWADAYGLMQIIPKTAKEIAEEVNINYENPENLFNAEFNINFGTYYVQKLLDMFENRAEWMLAAYNAGPHRVHKWKNFQSDQEVELFIENIEFQQTRIYVRRVMRAYWIYQLFEELSR